jgi:Lipopolysaccharide kinase (Kdo/WaaP) family
MLSSRSVTRIASQYQPILRELGIDAEVIFDHPLVKPWRKLSDRENCTLDATLFDGRTIRWHIKRYNGSTALGYPVNAEIGGFYALKMHEIPTAEMIGYGKMRDRRSFIIFEDLAGYTAAEKLIQTGTPFDRLLNLTADLAAKLHNAGLHHRDLYLCHFFARLGNYPDIRLSDTARVRRMASPFTRTRWIVKDLAQFWYSTQALPITDQQRSAWLTRYAEQRGLNSTEKLQRKIERKAAWIAKHDERLRRQQPNRNISIPHAP